MTATPQTPAAAPNPLGAAAGHQLRVVGVDLSLTATGLADRGWCQIIGSSGKRGDPWTVRGQRLRRMRFQILAHTRHADLVVIEGPSYGSHTPGSFDRAGLWWSLVSAFQAREQPCAIVAPSTRMRYATGKGRATKGQVYDAAVKRLGHVWTDLDGDDNLADAAWLCAMGHDRYGQPLADMPVACRDALSAVDWPLEEVA